MPDRLDNSAQSVQRVLHVLNYGWPHIDGYTVRSSGLITAQHRYLGLDVAIAVSPFTPLAGARDTNYRTPVWHETAQIAARRYRTKPSATDRLRGLERPGLGLAPATQHEFRAELTSIVRRLAPDVIHAHHPHYVGETALSVARAFGLPFVYELRCFNGDYDLGRSHPYARLRGQVFNRREDTLCRAADAVVTISDGLAERIIDAGTARARVFVVRNSIESERFVPETTRSGRSADALITLGYACTFSEMEGLDTLVDAVARLPGHIRERLQIRLAGQGPDHGRIAARIVEHDVGDTITLTGFIAYGEMPAFYAGLDLFVVPRKASPVASATTPLKPLEARAAGVALLVSDLPALRELLGEEADDVRFFSPNADALAKAIISFVYDPWSGRETRDDSRSWQREITRYRAVYEHASARARRAVPSSDRTGVPTARARRGVRRLARRVVDSPLPGIQALDTHVVICGFPRTGSTLLQLMIEACVDDVRTFDGEINALWAARYGLRSHSYLLTKQPRDIEQIAALRAFYRQRRGRVHFIVTVRDPRAVLTSAHSAYPESRGYYVDFARWQAIYDRFQTLATAADITVLRYEDLVSDPGTVQARLAAAIGWHDVRDFAHYDTHLRAAGHSRDSMTEGALGGFRSVETDRLASWRAPKHAERMQEMLTAIPALPDHLITLGYETDYRWLDALA